MSFLSYPWQRPFKSKIQTIHIFFVLWHCTEDMWSSNWMDVWVCLFPLKKTLASCVFSLYISWQRPLSSKFRPFLFFALFYVFIVLTFLPNNRGLPNDILGHFHFFVICIHRFYHFIFLPFICGLTNDIQCVFILIIYVNKDRFCLRFFDRKIF